MYHYDFKNLPCLHHYVLKLVVYVPNTMHKPIWEFIFKNLVGTHGAVEISVSKMAFSLDVTKPHCLSSPLMDEDFML